jgi:hypothetical protein
VQHEHAQQSCHDGSATLAQDLVMFACVCCIPLALIVGAHLLHSSQHMCLFANMIDHAKWRSLRGAAVEAAGGQLLTVQQSRLAATKMWSLGWQCLRITNALHDLSGMHTMQTVYLAHAVGVDDQWTTSGDCACSLYAAVGMDIHCVLGHAYRVRMHVCC